MQDSLYNVESEAIHNAVNSNLCFTVEQKVSERHEERQVGKKG
jgi:hypothetical protein